MKIIKKDGKNYVQLGNRAIAFNKVDEKGRPIITPKIERTKNKKGGYDVKVLIPSLKIKYKTNGNL